MIKNQLIFKMSGLVGAYKRNRIFSSTSPNNEWHFHRSMYPWRIPVLTPAGSLVMFGSMLPHGSLVNKTETIRWSMDLRYQTIGAPTGRWYVPLNLQKWSWWLTIPIPLTLKRAYPTIWTKMRKLWFASMISAEDAYQGIITQTEVDGNGQLDFDFYLASNVLASTPTAVHTLRRIIFPHNRSASKSA